jgi:hypothetical protein
MSGFVMMPLCKRLARFNLKILNLTYQSLSPQESQIFQQIDDFIDGKETIIICHSLGGLIARAYLEHSSVQSRYIKKVVTLGTPHKGSAIAKYIHHKNWNLFLKNSADYLVSENKNWPFDAKLYSIAGTLPLGLMPFFAKGKSSDGTVLLDETRLTGMTEHKVFHLSHTTLIFSHQVVKYIKMILES